MVLSSVFTTLRGLGRPDEGSRARKEGHLVQRLWDTLEKNWYLGFTSFGGPPVHFRIVCDIYQRHDSTSKLMLLLWDVL